MVRHSPDGKYFASCSADCTVRLWDDLTAQSVAVFNQHKASVTCVQFSRNGLLASGGWDNDVVIFNVASRQAVHHLRGHTARVTHIAFTPSGDLLASASSDCAVRVWSPSTGECYDKFEVHEGDVSQVGLSAGTLVSCSADGTIWRMDIKNERPPDHPVRIHTAPIAALAFSPDESVTATVSHDGSAALWDTATLNNICRSVTTPSPLCTEQLDSLAPRVARGLAVSLSPATAQSLAASSTRTGQSWSPAEKRASSLSGI